LSDEQTPHPLPPLGQDSPLTVMAVTFSPPVVFANPTMAVGEAATGSGTALVDIAEVGTYILDYSSSATFEVLETVTVPAGNYDTARVRVIVTVSGDIEGIPYEDTYTQVHWMARRIGPVKWTQSSSLLGTEAGDLTATNVSPPAGVLSFSASQYSVNEAAGSAAISVTRTAGDFGAISVLCYTTDDTATAGEDYTARSSADGWLDWADADTTSKVCTVPIINDSAVEGDETVQVDLSSPTGGAELGSLNTATLTIVDNDSCSHDFNGDGKSDILWRDSVTATSSMWLMNGGTPSPTYTPSVASTDWQVVGIGDFNGDGKDDILWRDGVTATSSMWLMDGGTPSPTYTPSVASTDWQVVGIGDFNGDGKDDILWRDSVTATSSMWLMDGGTPSPTYTPSVASTDWQVVGIGDFNGDGKSDILWRDSVTATSSMWLMDGGTPSPTYTPSVASTDWQVQ